MLPVGIMTNLDGREMKKTHKKVKHDEGIMIAMNQALMAWFEIHP
jgi:hypothetical protein